MIDWTELRVDFENGVPVSGEVVFSHEDEKTGEVRHFAVERIEKWLKTVPDGVKIMEIELDPVFATFAMTMRGVEMHRWGRVTTETIQNNPIIAAHMPGVGRDHKDSEHLIIDGIHRYTKAVALGMKTIWAWSLEPEQWEPYLVRVPEAFNEITKEQLEGQANGIPIDSRIK